MTSVNTYVLARVLEVCKGSLEAHLKINKTLKEVGYVK